MANPPLANPPNPPLPIQMDIDELDQDNQQIIEYTMDEFHQFMNHLNPIEQHYAITFFNNNSNYILVKQ